MAERRWRRAVAVATATAALLLAGCSSSEPGAFHGTRLTSPYDVATASLTDTEGEPFSLAADTGKPLTLVFFGYTHCPDICPQVLGNLASALVRLDQADRDDLQVVFVTTDPSRDDQARIREYLDGFDESFEGLTGDLDTIIELGDSLKIYINDGEKLPSGGYDLGGHTTSTIALDDDDQAIVYWSDTTSPAQFAADIHTLLEEQR